MPSLKQLSCSIELGSTNTKLTEYGKDYGDGHVTSYIAVPGEEVKFSVHLSSTGYIASGLAMFVFMDGHYQCNRNRRGLVLPGPRVSAEQYEVDLRVRQKESKQADGSFLGRDWSFHGLNLVSDDKVDGVSEAFLNNLGTIEVVVLRCKEVPEPPVSAPTKDTNQSFPQHEKVSKPKESSHKKKASTKAASEKPESEMGGLFGLFDGTFDSYGNLQPKAYWESWNKPSNSKNARHQKDIYIAPEEPLPQVPISAARKQHVQHQVKTGKGAAYSHLCARPEYLDSMKQPYAVFTFKYRSKKALEKKFKIDIKEEGQDLKAVLADMTKDELAEELFKLRMASKPSHNNNNKINKEKTERIKTDKIKTDKTKEATSGSHKSSKKPVQDETPVNVDTPWDQLPAEPINMDWAQMPAQVDIPWDQMPAQIDNVDDFWAKAKSAIKPATSKKPSKTPTKVPSKAVSQTPSQVTKNAPGSYPSPEKADTVITTAARRAVSTRKPEAVTPATKDKQSTKISKSAQDKTTNAKPAWDTIAAPSAAGAFQWRLVLTTIATLFTLFLLVLLYYKIKSYILHLITLCMTLKTWLFTPFTLVYKAIIGLASTIANFKLPSMLKLGFWTSGYQTCAGYWSRLGAVCKDLGAWIAVFGWAVKGAFAKLLGAISGMTIGTLERMARFERPEWLNLDTLVFLPRVLQSWSKVLWSGVVPVGMDMVEEVLEEI